VSKWVGETERNLDAAFAEAEDSASVLMFDEADSLFAKRGEIRHGTDRYSNLEVGFLLQRLEQSSGLVILATNLRENLDDAFTRRFNAILHFPRPGLDERRRIWARALPPELTPDVDLDTLSRLDLTGAGIVAIAQTAALLAAEEGTDMIEMRHAVRATTRQFRREGRVLAPSQLAQHASLLG
jgi:SpoVK/Ycf46/Vps4 family AAA+-type ATPase